MPRESGSASPEQKRPKALAENGARAAPSTFRLTFHDCGGNVVDKGKVETDEGLAGARAAAVERAREIMAAEVLKGSLCLSCWIVISDERGGNLATLQFGEAIDLPVQPACGHETRTQVLRAPHGADGS